MLISRAMDKGLGSAQATYKILFFKKQVPKLTSI